MKMELIATATFGLETVVRREIEKLGYEIIKTEDGRIVFGGDWDAVAAANLWLRAADRVYIKMGEFTARTFEELYQSVKEISWEEIIPADGRLLIEGTSVKSVLHSVPACQSIINKALADRLMKAYNADRLPETGERYKVRFSILKDRVLVSLDTSGTGLHKRGYRVSQVEAPIKETLAAALVELSFWNKDRILVDPCCGSGTIPIEAALIGRNIAPGLSRHFDAEEWQRMPREIWKEERRKAFEQADTETALSIYAFDIDSKAIGAAEENAKEAGVFEDIVFERRDVATLDVSGQSGVVITNPPYGERIGDDKTVKKVSGALRRFFAARPDWSLFVITGDRNAEKSIMGRKADRRRKLYNGNIETCYYQFHGEKVPKSLQGSAAQETKSPQGSAARATKSLKNSEE